MNRLSRLRERARLARAVGPRGAWSLRGQNARLAELRSWKGAVYRRIWTEAAAEVGAEVDELGDGFLELSTGGSHTRVRDELVALDDPVSIELSFDKPLVHRLLAAEGLPVPEHVEIDASSPAEAEAFLAGGRCVVKPASGTGVGAGVTGGLERPTEVARALAAASRYGDRILLERQVEGDVYRLLLLDGELVDTIRRRPPELAGDGRSTVLELVEAENRRRLDARGEAGLWLLRIDLDALLALERAGLAPGSVVPSGRTIGVKSVTNQNRVEDNETVREAPAPELVAEAAAAARAVGLRLAGVDIVAPSLAGSLRETGGVVLEVNCTPGLHHHYLVAEPERATRVAVPILRKLL
jgi:D-alanine-D-alanine ligase-like ATP-grasp enzyme